MRFRRVKVRRWAGRLSVDSPKKGAPESRRRLEHRHDRTMPISPPQAIDSPSAVDPTPAVDGTVPPSQGVFEPPSGFVTSAIARNKLIVCGFALALALLGVGLGLLRQPTYEASASLQVGQVNPNSPGFAGYTQSASSLATAFSRSVAAAPVLAAVEDKLKLTRAAATSRLSAEPIPLSPVFRVIATGPTESAAIRLANVASSAVVVYEGKSNSANPEAESLLRDYRDASVAVRRAEVKLAALGQGSVPPEALLGAEAEKSAAQVKREAIGKAYVSAVASQAPRSGLVSLLAGATSATGDRSSKIQLYGFVGLLVGLVVGCAVAVLRERRRSGRRNAKLGTGALDSMSG